MNITLQDLINAAQSAPEGTTPADAVTQRLAEAIAEADSDVNVQDLLDEAIAKFNEIHADGADSDETIAALEALAHVTQGARAQIAVADNQAEERRARLAELAKSVNPDGDESEEGDEGESTETPVEGEEAPETVEVPDDASEIVEPVAASAAKKRPVRVNLAAMQRKAPPAPKDSVDGISIVASADVPGFSVGQSIDGMKTLSRAANARLAGFPTSKVPNAQIRAGIAQFKTAFPAELTAHMDGNDLAVVEYAADHSRLPGGSLAASGGWCSPSETLYDLAGELESATTGILSVSDISTPRGGIRFTEGPDFSTIWSNTGFVQTETQAIAGTEKPFYTVPCTNFTDVRADVIGAGIRSGILNNDAYPELTEKVVRMTLVAHAHRVNFETIKRIEAASTAVTANVGPSSSLSLLNTVELQVIDYRYKYRASDALLLEGVLPIWARGVIRSDLALRTGVDLTDVTDQQIDAHFKARGVVMHWVYDWQDSFSGVSGGFGGATARTTWPTSVKVLLYAAGTFIRGRGEVISLEGLYDTVSIKTNDFVRLFTEEKILVARRQYSSRVLTVALSTSGITAAAKELDAQGNVVVETP